MATVKSTEFYPGTLAEALGDPYLAIAADAAAVGLVPDNFVYGRETLLGSSLHAVLKPLGHKARVLAASFVDAATADPSRLDDLDDPRNDVWKPYVKMTRDELARKGRGRHEVKFNRASSLNFCLTLDRPAAPLAEKRPRKKPRFLDE